MHKERIKEEKKYFFERDQLKKDKTDKRGWRCPFAGLIGPDGAKYPNRRDVTR